MRSFGGRAVSKQTKRAARKLMRGKTNQGGDFERQTKGASRKQRKRAAVATVYASKRQAKFGKSKHQKELGTNAMASLGVARTSFKNGGLIQHD